METKASNLSCARTRRNLGFDNMFCVESRGLSGGLCLFWKSNINIDVYAWCDNFIKAQISTVNDNVWEGIFVYGHPDFKRRKELWNELTCVDNNLHVPRAFIGDFNDVIAQHEKVGLHPKPTSQIDTFRCFIDKNALMDLELQGTKYTWFSNPRNGFVTKERIDRVLANWEWREAFQHATLSALPAISSDHRPLVLNVTPRGIRTRCFKFEAFWADHADCGNIIRKGWNSVCNSSVDHWTNLSRRMNSCKQELVKWSKANFKRADDFLLRNGRWLVGNGERVRILDDNWILNMTNSPVVMNDDVTFVKELISEGQGWNMSELRKHFDGDTVGKIIRTPEPESTEHALLLCPWTRAAWFGAQIQCCPTAYTVSSFGKWIMDFFKSMKIGTGTDYELCSSRVGFLVWEVWKARNQAVHHRSKPSPLLVIQNAKQMEIDFADVVEEPAISSNHDRRTDRRVTWRPPPPGWIKCNVDAAFREVYSAGATAAVFRDHAGSLLTASNHRIAASSPLAAEAFAVREALIMAKNFQLDRIIFESDSLILIQALKSKASIAEIQVILDDILELVRSITNCGFTWVPREGNGLAHEVARLTADGSLQQNWLRCRPQIIINILAEEHYMSLQLANRS
ncbi:hypothetical protein Ahy_B03g068364 [Arachis hypogaea]|uniref:RNase H type-1 domain-containing protein n=1 Tax=Arachis hypogaea TaxID=3818 RepID=A0A445A9F4_ARAHY|nr:hypothetical protein Ahy_B03g068364 [Arachis hypogaea]